MVGSLLFQSGWDRLGVNERVIPLVWNITLLHTPRSSTSPYCTSCEIAEARLVSQLFPSSLSLSLTNPALIVSLSYTSAWHPWLLRKQFCLPVPSLPTASSPLPV